MPQIVFSPNGYNVVYFHAETELPVTPNVTFMKKLHAALGVEARTYMHKLYVVHPNFMLRAHLTLLATVEPIYRKVQYVETVRLSSRPARARAPPTARPARP